MKQYIITPAMGKRLIGLGMAEHPQILRVLESGTLVIIAGSTNGYVAEEILKRINYSIYQKIEALQSHSTELLVKETLSESNSKFEKLNDI